MRLLAFIVVCILAFTLPWWAALVAAAVYAFRYTAYELIVLGIFLDAHYGVALSWLPVPIFYTVAQSGILLVSEALKPMMSFYEERG